MVLYSLQNKYFVHWSSYICKWYYFNGKLHRYINNIKISLNNTFKIKKYLGHLKYLLGLEIAHSIRGDPYLTNEIFLKHSCIYKYGWSKACS